MLDTKNSILRYLRLENYSAAADLIDYALRNGDITQQEYEGFADEIRRNWR